MADQAVQTGKRPHVETENESATEPANGHASKKTKLDANGTIDDGTCVEPGVITSFGGFHTMKVLNEDSERKSIFLLGRFGESGKDAVVILNKTPLSEELSKDMLTETSALKNIMQNDIYGTYELFPKPELNGMFVAFNTKKSSRGCHMLKYSLNGRMLGGGFYDSD